MDKEQPKLITERTIAVSGGTSFNKFQNYQRILKLLFQQLEKMAGEDYILKELSLDKDILMSALEQLINNGYISHVFQDRQHMYRLLTLDWEIQITLSPTTISPPNMLVS